LLFTALTAVSRVEDFFPLTALPLKGTTMQVQHHPNGRVGPPRCHECNAPLGIDDAAFSKQASLLKDLSQFLCNDCRELMMTQ